MADYSLYNLTRKTSVLAKIETTYGTDPGITGAANAMLLFDEVNPYQRDTKIVQKDVVRSSFTKYPDLVGRTLSMVKMKTVLMGSGTAGSAPFFAPLLKACGLSEASGSSGGGSYVQYKPVSGSFSSAYIGVYAQELLHKVGGAYGTFTMEGRAGEAVDVSFDFKGLYTAASTSSVPTLTLPTDRKVLMESENLDFSSTTGSYVPIVKSFRFDRGVQIIERGDFNASKGLGALLITDSRPTLNLIVEVQNTLANKNFETILDNATVADRITWTHGSVAGNKAVFTINDPQLVNVQYQDDQGVRTYALDYKLQNTTAEGEFTIDFR